MSAFSAGASGDDGGAGDASVDSGWGSGDAGAILDGGTCSPADVSSYHPMYHPAGVELGACTEPQMTLMYSACFAPATKDSGLCKDFINANGACADCILTPESATRYGPIVDHGGFLTENVAGCIEVEVDRQSQADSGASELGCAKAIQALEGCELAACEINCPVSDASSLASFSKCASAADAAGCQTFAAEASCANPDADAGPLPSACVQPDFQSFYQHVARLFCGALPAVDAGSPAPPDAASGD